MRREMKSEKGGEPCLFAQSKSRATAETEGPSGPLPGRQAGSLLWGAALRRLRLWRLLHWASGEGSEWASPQGPAVPPAQRDQSRGWGSAGR